MNRRSLFATATTASAAVPGLVVLELDSGTPVPQEPPTPAPRAESELAEEERHLLDIINAFRADHRVRALRPDPRLQEVARGRVARISGGALVPLSHDLPVGGTLYDLLPAVHLASATVGELLSVAEPWLPLGATVDANLDKFVHSPAHRDALLFDWMTHAGAASAWGAQRTQIGLYSVVVLGYLPA